MTHLSDDEITWITNPMKRHNRGVFESDSGRRALVMVLDYGISNQKNPIFFNTVESDIYEATGRYSLIVTLPTGDLEGRFRIIKSAKNDSLIFKGNLGHCFNDKENIRAKDTILLGRDFKNCVVVDSTNTRPGEKSPVSSCIFSKSYGLIFFELESGEKFYRKFKTPTDSITDSNE